MKSKIMAGVLMFIIISVLLTGCGGKQKEIPYPDGYYVPKPEETETAGKAFYSLLSIWSCSLLRERCVIQNF